MKKILIVDDSEIQRISLGQGLRKAGYEVVEAANGVEALGKLATVENIVVIITDLNMPDMDGITMCKKLKEQKTHIGVPIFILTSEATPELKARSKEAGVLAWIVKPHVTEKVIAAIEKFTQKQ